MTFTVIRCPLNFGVPLGGVFSVPYPAGKTKDDFAASEAHMLVSARYGAIRQPKIGFAFNDDAIAITNSSGVGFDAGTVMLVQIEDFVAAPTSPDKPTTGGIQASELAALLGQIASNANQGPVLAAALVSALNLLQDDRRLSIDALRPSADGLITVVAPGPYNVGDLYALRVAAVDGDTVQFTLDKGPEVQISNRSLVSFGTDGSRQFHALSSFVQSSSWAVLTEAATITCDLDVATNFEFTLTASRILDFSNFATKKGASGLIKVKQNATGGWGLTISNANVLASAANGGVIVLNSGASEWSILAYAVDNDGKVNVL